MQSLKFLGRGGAFFTEEGNTSAYYITNNDFILIDCGEMVFHTLINKNKFKNIIDKHNIKNIYVCITHLHSDHAGSLSSFIHYCYYVLNLIPNIYFPDRLCIKTYLGYQGNFNNQYKYIEKAYFIEQSHLVKHVDNIRSYSYSFNVDNKKIFYSGDCSELPNINIEYYNELYLECSLEKTNCHMSFDELKQYINVISNKLNIFLIHIDNLDLINKASLYGFNVVEING